LDFNALHRVGGAMEAVLAEMKAFIMIDHHQNRMIMQHTLFRHLFGSAKCYTTISFLDKKKTSTRQLEPAFIQEY
jgi:phosphoesterase RecJ-like protein